MVVERREQMFPSLSPAEMERLTSLGHRRRVGRGEVLYEQGEATPDFYVVVSGALELVQPGDGHEVPITVLRPGQFTGEINMLSGRRSMARARMAESGELLAITPEALRKLVQFDVELSDIFMRASILRRVALIASSQGDTVLIGSTHSAATLRIREFLTRNGEPHAYLDVDKDPGVQALLDRFALRVDDVPVVICRYQRVLKSPSNEEVAECLGFIEALDPKKVRDLVVVR
jgi:thioredoxin reductase (NADPH)